MKLDENLSWNAHINDLIEKIAFGIGALNVYDLLFLLQRWSLFTTL
jgi:hypothetical protein